MLGGKDPIIIFQFSKLLPSVGEVIAKIPIVSEIPTLIDAPPIPIYLSETLTGLLVDTEAKNVDIESHVETMSDGDSPVINQKGINSSVSISLTGKKDSVGLTLLSAMIDILFDKASSKEYNVSYLHGAVTVFRGVIQSYQVQQNSNEDKLSITIELSKGQKQPAKPSGIPETPRIDGAILAG